jgi:hypothetical protein
VSPFPVACRRRCPDEARRCCLDEALAQVRLAPSAHAMANLPMIVPDDFPKYKRPLHPAPWGERPDPDAPPTSFVSTYQQSYASNATSLPRVLPAVPKPSFGSLRDVQHGRASGMPTTTAQASFGHPASHEKAQSFKPVSKFQSVPNVQPLRTTADSSYTTHPGHRRVLPCVPPSRSKPDGPFVGAPTTRTSYPAPPSGLRRVLPVIPPFNGSIIADYGSGGASASYFKTTAEASYMGHAAAPYRKAVPPKPKLGQITLA